MNCRSPLSPAAQMGDFVGFRGGRGGALSGGVGGCLGCWWQHVRVGGRDGVSTAAAEGQKKGSSDVRGAVG